MINDISMNGRFMSYVLSSAETWTMKVADYRKLLAVEMLQENIESKDRIE